LRGAKQLVEVRQLRRVVAPCAADRTVRVDQEGRSVGDVLVAAELSRYAESVDRLGIPVGQEREVQVESL